RVVLAWDADDTDVDLHVIDPNGEEVYYGHRASYQGGAITRDATGGYGPEEFALKVAKPGRYRVEANFYGHRQQMLTSSTGLMLWLSSDYGSARQQDRRTTTRVRSEHGERVAVGEFEVRR
ncbi:MAG: YfaP family protein, partial [Caldimonas sp.]